MQRVQKILSACGYCSRREAEKLIEAGKVKVNGSKISLGDKAGDGDVVTVNGKKLRRPRRLYVAFHKPKGCVTAVSDKKYKTVLDYVKMKERIFPVGRLDYNTTGLLLLTNDGDFANEIMHPRYELPKTYRVVLEKPLNKEDWDTLEKGVELDDGKTAPAKIVKRNNDYMVTIHEGRNRIIRRMFGSLNYEVKELIRVKIGKLSIGKLPLGKWKFIKPEEV